MLSIATLPALCVCICVCACVSGPLHLHTSRKISQEKDVCVRVCKKEKDVCVRVCKSKCISQEKTAKKRRPLCKSNCISQEKTAKKRKPKASCIHQEKRANSAIRFSGFHFSGFQVSNSSACGLGT